MESSRVGTRPFVKGAATNFTGTVLVEMLFDRSEPSRLTGASVIFEPGARTAWHSHPLGQTLIVTSGCGLHQCEGMPIEVIRPGDVILCPANTKHWHGATSITAMSHLAIQEKLDRDNVLWMEHVSDEQYVAGEAAIDPDRAKP